MLYHNGQEAFLGNNRLRMREDTIRNVPPMEWRIYPPIDGKRFPYQRGQAVLVKSKDPRIRYWRGTISNTVIDGQEILVQLDDAGKKLPLKLKDCKKLVPLFVDDNEFCDHTVRVVITAETNYFRQLAFQVNGEDSVLEIGCANGETSKLLIPRARSWVGFDTSDDMIEDCRRFMEGSKKCHIVKVDALVHPGHAFDQAIIFGFPNVLFLDIGGNRECPNVMRMLSWAFKSWRNELRLVIVKSQELVHSLKTTSKIHIETGVVQNGHCWFEEYSAKRALPKHPLRAPLVLSPKDGITPICRYHNYHKLGCTLQNCPLDHDHCPLCNMYGHKARECPDILR